MPCIDSDVTLVAGPSIWKGNPLEQPCTKIRPAPGTARDRCTRSSERHLVGELRTRTTRPRGLAKGVASQQAVADLFIRWIRPSEFTVICAGLPLGARPKILWVTLQTLYRRFDHVIGASAE
jgi:hypothetical protein